MPVYTYTRDFREQDGETARADYVKENLKDIQDAANGMTWINVARDSLDQFHAKPGEPYKEIGGKYRKWEPGSQLQGLLWHELGSISVPVRPDNGVYVIASTAGDSTNFPEPTPTNMGLSRAQPARIQLRLSATSATSPTPAGQWELSYGYNVEVNGGAGIVWAYKVESGLEHEVALHFRAHGPDSRPAPGRPVSVNLVVFVIDR